MIVEWLAPVSALVFTASLLRSQLRAGWRDWEDWVRIAGISIVGYAVLEVGFSVSQSLFASIADSIFMLTMAFIPPRFVLRLIKAKRPNEIEDPELFENGELKPEARDKLLADPTQRNDP